MTQAVSGQTLSDEDFARLLPRYTPEKFIDPLRGAARGMVEARTKRALREAGLQLGSVVQKYGAYYWPLFMAAADRNALSAMKTGHIPGLQKANATDPAIGAGSIIFLAVLALIYHALQTGNATPPLDEKEPATIMPAKPPRDAKDPEGAKAPGKPGPEDGFEDPEDGENWVPNPNGKGYGWLDSKGDVWVPTGRGALAHRGPHWDVQTPGGEYRNVLPTRPSKGDK